MSNAKKDENGRATMIAVSSSDGETIELAQANISHNLLVDDNTTGTVPVNRINAILDENSVSGLMALSSDGSGTLVQLVIDPLTKKLLIDSN